MMNRGGSSYGNCHDFVRRRCRCGCHCDVCGRHFHPEKPAPNRPGQGGRPCLRNRWFATAPPRKPGGPAGLSAEPEPAAWEERRPGSPPAYPTGQGADLPLPASAAGKRPLLRILRSASQRVRLQLPGRQPMPDKACPEIKAAGGFPPRDRPVSELSAGGREGLFRTQTLQMRGLLEGL